MVKINLKESTELEFDMQIEGNMTKLESLGLCIQEHQFELKLPCEWANSKITCRIPILEGIVEAGEKNIILEVVIDGKVYRPFEQTVEFEKPLSIRTQLSMVEESVKAPSISLGGMSVRKAKIVEEAPRVSEPPAVRQSKTVPHNLAAIQRRVEDLLEKVSDSRISAKAALREAYIKVSQDRSSDKLIKVWSKMLQADGVILEGINSDREAMTCLEALASMLNKLSS